MNAARLALVALLCLAGRLPVAALEPARQDLFVGGEGGYHTYRIPSLIVGARGAVLAFCEGRRAAGGDSGDIDLLLRRSTDNGATWGPVQVVWDDGANTIGNPCPVLDRKTGHIHLLLTRNLGEDTEREIMTGKSVGTREAWVMRSTDEGATWREPENITPSAKRDDWTWYATGPGVGIALASGRLVVPCDFAVAGTMEYGSHVLLSDDHGETWRIGGAIEGKVNECQVVETRPGELLLNMRSYHGKNRRAIARSTDGGETWGEVGWDDALIEPVCQAALIALPANAPDAPARLLFANPASEKREKMTIRLSEDGGETWTASREVHGGPSAYSALARFADETIGLLYERGEKNPYERIELARFPVEWIAGATGPAMDEGTGVRVGEPAPAFALPDAAGDIRTLADLAKDRPLLLVFHRSASWCPFCQKQLRDLQKDLAKIEGSGVRLAAISYDSPAELKRFAAGNGIEYVLLSDEGSQTIDAWGVRNKESKPGTRQDGIPHPGIFVVGADGRVKAKLFLEGYAKRPTTEEILALVEEAKGR